MPQSIATKIAGIFRYPEGKEIVNSAPSGTEYTFEREPTNIHDKNAIRVFSKDIAGKRIMLGYVPKEVAAKLATVNIVTVVKGDKFDAINIIYE